MTQPLCGTPHGHISHMSLGEVPMRVIERSICRGPHLYSARPMIRIRLDLGALEGLPTHIDQHFAGRGRIGRLLGAVAHNPRILGIRIDEDSAIVVEGEHFTSIGSGAVTVVDAAHVTHSNITEAKPQCVLSIHNVTLHALSEGDGFHLTDRRPCSPRTNG